LQYAVASVTGVRELCPGVKEYSLRLREPLMSSPGQYLMVWVPGVGEIPISVAWEEGREAGLVIAKVGLVTGHIHGSVKAGSRLFLRGPLGRGFSLDCSRPLIVAGGYGNAPLYHLARTLRARGVGVTAVLGFKTARDAILVEEFGRSVERLVVATEDGSMGVRGTAVDAMLSLLSGGRYDFVYTCGKELLMRRVVEEAVRRGIRVEASLERRFKCGIGLCGSCAIEPLGLRVCRDGPVFDGETLLQTEDFGRWWYDATGRRVPVCQ